MRASCAYSWRDPERLEDDEVVDTTDNIDIGEQASAHTRDRWRCAGDCATSPQSGTRQSARGRRCQAAKAPQRGAPFATFEMCSRDRRTVGTAVLRGPRM